MPHPNPQALEFLLSRRSRPAKTLTAPVPSRAQLEPLLTAALRTPDHGKLEPWRLVVLDKAALNALGDPVEARGVALGLDAEQIAKGRHQFDTGNLAVVVIEAPVISEKVPEVEQTYSAGAVCLALLNAALASGWGANWLSGWASHDRPFVETSLGLAPHERVAGIIHIGTEKAAPPERPRPDLERKVTWVSN
ncbi:nitroreductase family protein [Shimia thalassica]|uniref:nitroreductase family protein n=1 Tax=Shimia thalassica TaxID=1715693 RepID=UPI000C069283|nr:nitroreductase family protein [Shimia thalassica]PHO03743.1 nitroreductase [Rhodobacteraceae bacterium 4F10]MBU2942228.1 nitroreductase family protein [Shimia thalassica]MDO6482753.1 nitroreductase family protein [Shimia thalassica]MDO6502802.1 nitroreductase family protein [Shimia thalassica]MDO6522593.1 nitroreductase family protein [Shimia thalassica]